MTSSNDDNQAFPYKIFVILLESDKQRVTHVHDCLIKECPMLNIFSAIEGKNLQKEQFEDLISEGYVYQNYWYNRQNDIPFKWGQIGCALSHITLWENMLKDGDDRIIILEDDVQLKSWMEDLSKTSNDRATR
jgi:GR25 family glycosyltransferase involved in LPS biosynthesis